MIPTIDTAAILAGGQNLRFNRNMKPLATFKDKTILEHQLGVLQIIFREILLITNTPEAFGQYTSCRKFKDLIPGAGPLSGIHTALKKSGKKNVFIVAGDMPFINGPTIRDQIKTWEQNKDKAVVPMIAGHPEPLHTIYPFAGIDKLEEILHAEGNQSVKEYLDAIPVYYWDVQDKRPFININTPEELKRYEKG